MQWDSMLHPKTNLAHVIQQLLEISKKGSDFGECIGNLGKTNE